MSPRVVCAWCSRVLREGSLPVSHGICDNCRYLFQQDTPAGSGRVEFFLAIDCGVRRHRFLNLSSGWQICEWCGKQQSPLGALCMVCNNVGEGGSVRLRNVEGAEPDATGLVCGECAEEFHVRREIDGWELLPA